MKELFVTNVGSHLWGMERPDSDIDLFVCYLAPSEDFLIGKRHEGGHHSIDNNIDRQSFELGHVVNQLLKNNFNHVIGVLSPIVVEALTYSPDDTYLKDLKKLTEMNLSTQIYHSIHGLAIHNYKKYIQTAKDISAKRCALIIRTVRFGIKLLARNHIIFESTPLEDATPTKVKELISHLDYYYHNSKLPSEPMFKKEMYDWLLDVRIRNLSGDLP